jgi:hypothetical protein
MRYLSLRSTKKLPCRHHVTKQVGTISSQTQKLAKTPIFSWIETVSWFEVSMGRIDFFFAEDAEPPL